MFKQETINSTPAAAANSQTAGVAVIVRPTPAAVSSSILFKITGAWSSYTLVFRGPNFVIEFAEVQTA
jgi:hypothetical protein